MSAELFIGIDLGSSAVKALLVHADGRIGGAVRLPHAIDHPRPGWAEMDAERIWWGLSMRAVAQLLASTAVPSEAIAGIGLCGIGASFVPVDADGCALRPGILYGIDNRAVAQIERLNRELGEQQLLSATARRLSAQSVGPKILWLRENEPEVWRRTAWIASPVAYVTARLCGRFMIDVHTALSYDPLFSPSTMTWNPAIRESMLGDGPRLPDVGWPGAACGTVNRSAARLTGLREGTPVACGTADVVAEAVGSGVGSVGDLLVMYGSTLFLLERVTQFAPRPPLWPSYLLGSEQPTLLTGTSSAGSLLDWFMREFGGADRLQDLVEQAQRIAPGADGLLCLPYFAGERAPIFDADARGMLIGLSHEHSRAHVLRALLEGIAFSFRHNLCALATAGQPPERLFASGGGSRIPLWRQVMSDVSGLPQQVCRVAEGGALGAAYLGAIAAGAFDAAGSLPQPWMAGGSSVQPDAAAAERYSELYPLYLHAYQSNRDLLHALARARPQGLRSHEGLLTPASRAAR